MEHARIFADDAQMIKEQFERCLDRKIDREVMCKIRRMTNCQNRVKFNMVNFAKKFHKICMRTVPNDILMIVAWFDC